MKKDRLTYICLSCKTIFFYDSNGSKSIKLPEVKDYNICSDCFYYATIYHEHFNMTKLTLKEYELAKLLYNKD